MSKWDDLINRFNFDEDDLCDLLDAAEKVGRADAIDELKSNCITHILRKRPLTLEEITNIIFFEAEKLKENKNDCEV